jgi:hypothetical protein
VAVIEFETKARKLLLLVSPKNPFWKPLLSGTVTQAKITEFVGISGGLPWHWRNATEAKEETTNAMFAAIEANIEARPIGRDIKDIALAQLRQFQTVYNDDGKSGVTRTAAIFEMTLEQSRFAIDEIIYDRRPLLPTAYYSEGDARKYLRLFGGAYQVLVKRGEVWLLCAMHVRYIIPGTKGSFIRCKLNFPKVESDPEQEYSVYDGVLVVRQNNNLFWIFESREERAELEDHSYFITRAKGRRCQLVGRNSETGTSRAGTYLTSSSEPGEPIVADRILIQEIRLKDFDARENFMNGGTCHTPIGIINDKQQCTLADDLWQQLIGI